MEDLFVLKKEIDPLLRKKSNAKVLDYLEHLENHRKVKEEFNCQSSERLGMNNDILHLNFEDLVDILGEYDSSLEVIRANIVSPDGAVAGVSTATEKMTVSTENIAEKITSQSSSLLEFFSALEELTASISHVAKSTTDAKTIVDSAMATMKFVSENAHEYVNAIEAIRESSEQITDIAKVIQQISGRSNLLAMNAAIEAAHAGKQGQGFAVVAEEMRKLSDNSSQEAKKINVIVKDVSERINSAVTTSSDVLSSNEKISVQMGEVVNITEQIQNAMQEQESGTQEVLLEVKKLSDNTMSINDSLAEQGNAVGVMTESCDELKQTAEQIGEVLKVEEITRNRIVDISNKIGRTYIRNNEICKLFKGA